MKKLLMLGFFLGILFGVQNAFAQARNAPQDPHNPPPDYVRRANENREYWDKFNGKDSMGMIKQPSNVVIYSRKKRKEDDAERAKFLDEVNQTFLAPLAYREKYAAFLKEKNTGIARMFPDKDCDKGLTVSVEELERCRNTPQIKGAGSLYSVRLNAIPKNLPLNYILMLIGLSDIHFVGDKLVVGNAETLDIISEIGDVDLASLNAKSDAFKFLTEFKPAKTTSKFAEQTKTLGAGVDSNGYLYSTSAAVKLNSTYVLRSIAYSRGYESFWNTDILVAFKIVGQEADGSIIFVWKQLKEKFYAPELKNK